MNRRGGVRFALIGLVILSASLLTGPVSAQSSMKIGFVRPEFILSQYEPYREALKQVQAYEKAETDKIQTMITDFQKKYEDAQKQAPLMTEEKRNEKLKELEDQRAGIEKAQDNLMNRETGRLFKKHEEIVQPIFDRLNRVLEKYGQDEKFDFIFNVTTDTQNILYADKKFDVSEQIAELLKKAPTDDEPKKSAPAVPKSAAPKAPQSQQKK